MPPITRSSGMRCAMVSQAGVKQQQVGPRLPGKQVPVLPLPRARAFKRISQQVQAEEMPQVYEEAVHRPANRSRSSRTPPPPPPMNQRQRREDQAGLSIPKQYYQFLWCIFWAFICWKLASASCDRSCCDVCFSVVNSTNNSTTNSTSTSDCEIIILPGRCSSPDQEIKVSLPLYYTTQTNRHSSHPAHPHHPSRSTNSSTPPSAPPPTSSPSPSPSTKSRAAYYRISPLSRHRNMQHIRMRYTSICRFCPAGRCSSLRTRTRAEGSWIQRTRLCGNSIPLTSSRRR
jgi:hypothetical protein